MIKIKVKNTANLKEKIVGLIGKDRPENLLIKTRFGIHTFGVKFPIDVVVINKQNKIVTIKQNLKPNRIFFWNPIFNKVLELPFGTVKNNCFKKNQFLEILPH